MIELDMPFILVHLRKWCDRQFGCSSDVEYQKMADHVKTLPKSEWHELDWPKVANTLSPFMAFTARIAGNSRPNLRILNHLKYT